MSKEENGEHWLDVCNRKYQKEIDEVVKEDIINKAVSYIEKDTFVKMKNMTLPTPQSIEETNMWHRHMLKRMAINAGKTEEEMIQYLQELDRNPPSSTVKTPADPTCWLLKNLKKDQ